MIKNLYGALFAEGEILFFNEYSGNVTFTADAMGISCVKFNNINLHNANFMIMTLKLLFMSYFWRVAIGINNAKRLKK